jgi:ankyrin repeat protein
MLSPATPRMRSSLLDIFAKAIKDGDSNCVESMLTNGSIDANVRLPRQLNPPALPYAARWNQKAVVDVLLRFGARINDTDDDGRTACHVVHQDDCGAAAETDVTVLASLLAHQPNLELECKRGRTPLENALAVNGDWRTSVMLIEAGASLERVSQHLCHLATTSTTAIRALLRRGVASANCVIANNAHRCMWPPSLVATCRTAQQRSKCSSTSVVLTWRPATCGTVRALTSLGRRTMPMQFVASSRLARICNQFTI